MRLLGPTLTLMLASGCMTTTYQTSRRSSGEVRTEANTFFLVGLIGEATINLDQDCPDGVARIEEQFSPTDVLLQLVTLGIYCPTTVRVECAASTPSASGGAP